MVFSSLTFLFFFLPACVIAYHSVANLQLRNAILVASSVVFYAWGEPIWIVLLLGAACWDYLNGLFIGRFRNNRTLARLGVVSSLCVNLTLLGTFKYADFIVDTVNELTGLSFSRPGIALPIGISFYTFETISYVIDVYRGAVPAQRNPLKFLLFLVCFPRLVAGPIVRYTQLVREIEYREHTLTDFSAGVTRFTKGLFKKVFFANVAGELCQQFLGKDVAGATVGGEWFGLVMFSLQIYFDFSGYSDMAIGLGRMFGFHFPENFDHPYVSRSLTEFWRRWHISLGGFFREYVYIPLGGNRHHQTRNIFVVWALTGAWHGASWNFVLWGLYFAVFLLLEKNGLLRLLGVLPRLVQHLYALFFIVLGWGLFYFTDLPRLGASLRLLFGLSDAALYNYDVASALQANAFWLAFALVLCAPVSSLVERELVRLAGVRAWAGGVVLANLLFLAVSTSLLVGRTYNPFIYFRF